jgi:hypothetical protein
MVSFARSAAVLCLGLFVAAPFARPQSPAAASAPILPPAFSGWTATAAPQSGSDPAAADSANASVLKEYSLKDFASAEYGHGSSKLKIKAMHFADATGAYGAFTFYRKAEMHPDDVGKGGAVDTREAIFWTGTTLIDATGDHIGAEERAALQSLAYTLPQNAGPEGVPPSLPQYLPQESLDTATVHYAIGPAAYAKAGGVLPAEVIDFSRDAEAVTARYQTHDGNGILTVLEYPTPQIAGDRLKAIDAILKGTLPQSLQGGNAAALGVKRSGTLVAITSGGFSAAEANELRDAVKSQTTLTWNHPEGYGNPVGREVKKTARLLLGITYLTGILGGGALLLGLFLGGGRALIRVLRGKPPSSMNDDDFISLKLR